jgi:hypothetical protein
LKGNAEGTYKTKHAEAARLNYKYSMKLAAGRSSDALDFFVVIPE